MDGIVSVRRAPSAAKVMRRVIALDMDGLIAGKDARIARQDAAR